MGRDITTYLLLFLVLMLAQVLICNHIMLFGLAIPIIFIYPLLRLPMSMSVKVVLTISFLTGLAVDIFSDTPGVNVISCCILAVLRRPVFHLYVGNDEALQGVSPTIANLGFRTYFKYLFLLVPAYCLPAILLEYFTFTTLSRTLLIILSSSMLTLVILLGIDALTAGRKRN